MGTKPSKSSKVVRITDSRGSISGDPHQNGKMPEVTTKTKRKALQLNLNANDLPGSSAIDPSMHSSCTSLAPPSSFNSTSPKAHFPNTKHIDFEEQRLLDIISAKADNKQDHKRLQEYTNDHTTSDSLYTPKAGIQVNVRDIDDAMEEMDAVLHGNRDGEMNPGISQSVNRALLNNIELYNADFGMNSSVDDRTFDPEKFKQVNRNQKPKLHEWTNRTQDIAAYDDEGFDFCDEENESSTPLRFHLETGGALGQTPNKHTQQDTDSLDFRLDDVDEQLMQDIEASIAEAF
eukprot:gene4577-8574_t